MVVTKEKVKKDSKSNSKKTKRILWFISGEKGGVGKSVCAKLMISYFDKNNIPVVPVECDRSNPDLLAVYGKDRCQLTFFSENEYKQNAADKITELAIDDKKSLVVSLPAQAYNPWKGWIDRSGLVDLCAEDDIQVVNFFVSNGFPFSLNQFEITVSQMGDRIPHILVKNLRFREQWEPVFEKRERLRALLESPGFKQMDLPIIEYSDIDLLEEIIEEEGKSSGERVKRLRSFLELTTRESGVSTPVRRRFSKYIDEKISKNIDSLGLL